MKKTYSKPTLEVIAFEVNEAIASCDFQLYNHFNKDDCGVSDEGQMLFGPFLSELDKLFGVGEECEIEFEGYCYFTSTGSAKFLMNS